MKLYSTLKSLLLLLAILAGGASSAAAQAVNLLNVSYDPTREFYREFNQQFAAHWNRQTGQTVRVRMSHGGSGSQARSVIDGLAADVVTLALAADIDAIVEHGNLLPADWQSRLPNNSAPYTSTLAFLVRKGNPKNIRTWEDLARPGIEVITPNPKTSGVARWNYLAIWGSVLVADLGEDYATKINDPAHAEAVQRAQERARDLITAVYRNVPVLDTGARGSTNTFVQRGIGDVLINWENEILLGSQELDAAGLEMVVPPVSILAEPTVAVVDRNVERSGNRAAAQAYLEFLYTEQAQRLAGRHYYRPSNPEILAEFASQFPDVKLFTIDELFGGWPGANAVHFADGGTFDQIYLQR